MGNKGHKEKAQKQKQPPKFEAIKNHFESVEQIQEALQKAGLENSNLIIGTPTQWNQKRQKYLDIIIGIDYTVSNTDAGKRTFGGRSLHSIHPQYMNPYQHVISVISRTLAVL